MSTYKAAMNSIRIPFIGPLPSARVIPADAASLDGTVAALIKFLTSPHYCGPTVLLTGAGISVASGLHDYRGPSGTYIVNKSYRPIYFSEFVANHEARKRYWARSFLGWPLLGNSLPSPAHTAATTLVKAGTISHVITQNVDALHSKAFQAQQHKSTALPTAAAPPITELHGMLSHAHCLTCSTPFPRDQFQAAAARLNPAWAELLTRLQASGALSTEDPAARAALGLRTNPDGDVDLPGLRYTDFAYPPCPQCAESGRASVDERGAWVDPSNSSGGHGGGGGGGVLKPGVVMFGETVPPLVRDAAAAAVLGASRLLVAGSSLATYSAWRLVKQMAAQGGKVAVVNMGGIRGEAELVASGCVDVRSELDVQDVLPRVAKALA